MTRLEGAISPFSSFPVEIVRLILEFSGRADTLSASHLILVCHAVHDWVLPVLYETLTISKPNQCMLLHQRLSSSPMLSQYVKNISIRFHEGEEDLNRSTGTGTTYTSETPFEFALISILHSCQNLSNLNLSVSLDRIYRAASSYPISLPFPTTFLAQKLSHLHCASWDSWLYFSQYPHLYTSITHLRVDIPYNTGLSDSWNLITHNNPSSITLPSLTHLALAFDSRSSLSQFSDLGNLLKGLLKREKLESLVVLGSFCWDAVKFVNSMSAVAGIRDPRVKVLITPGSLDERTCFKEWDAAARGEKSVWDQSGISVTIPSKDIDI